MKYYLLSFLLLLFSCEEENHSSDVIGGIVEISIMSNEGVDLLNPSNPNALDQGKFKLYHLEDGEFKFVNEPNFDDPFGYYIYENNGVYRIGIFSDVLSKEEVPTSIIEWGEEDTDTLKYEIVERGNGSYIGISNVWFNDELVCEEGSDQACYFVITK